MLSIVHYKYTDAHGQCQKAGVHARAICRRAGKLQASEFAAAAARGPAFLPFALYSQMSVKKFADSSKV